VATESSNSSGKQDTEAETTAAGADTASTGHASAGDSHSVIEGETTLTDALFAAEKAKDTPAESDTEMTPPPAAPEPAPEPAAPPQALAPTAQPAKSGPGFMPLLIGGVVAAGLGYGAAYMGLLGTNTDDQSAEIAQALQAQSEALGALQTQMGELSNASPNLSPVLDELAGLSDRLDSTTAAISGVTERIEALESRPVLTGDGDADSAAMAAAMEILQAELGEQQAANEAIAEEMRAISEEAQAAIAAAETRTQETVAAAMAEAEDSVAAATAQAALGRLRIAMASGDPFADALTDLPDGVEVPEALSAVAETGVATVEELQARFPAAARAALPIALREANAEGGAGDRALAFLRGQFGGRAITPRDGTDPDAVLSRAQAAVTCGDLATATSEITALPEAAQAELADWTTEANGRVAADAALETLATALDGAN
jgi:hypothetical protein